MKKLVLLTGFLLLCGCMQPVIEDDAVPAKPEASSAASSIPANWETFTREAGGTSLIDFQVSYPKDWETFDDEGDGIFTVRPYQFESVQVDYCADRCGTTIDESCVLESLPGSDDLYGACRTEQVAGEPVWTVPIELMDVIVLVNIDDALLQKDPQTVMRIIGSIQPR